MCLKVLATFGMCSPRSSLGVNDDLHSQTEPMPSSQEGVTKCTAAGTGNSPLTTLKGTVTTCQK